MERIDECLTLGAVSFGQAAGALLLPSLRYSLVSKVEIGKERANSSLIE